MQQVFLIQRVKNLEQFADSGGGVGFFLGQPTHGDKFQLLPRFHASFPIREFGNIDPDGVLDNLVWRTSHGDEAVPGLAAETGSQIRAFEKFIVDVCSLFPDPGRKIEADEIDQKPGVRK